MSFEFDCIVAGISCVDLLIGPLDFDQPLNQEGTWALDTITPTVGGNVSNSSIALARLGSRTGALSIAGTDTWGDFLISTLQNEGVDTTRFRQRDTLETSATAVLMNDRAASISLPTSLEQMMQSTEGYWKRIWTTSPLLNTSSSVTTRCFHN